MIGEARKPNKSSALGRALKQACKQNGVAEFLQEYDIFKLMRVLDEQAKNKRNAEVEQEIDEDELPLGMVQSGSKRKARKARRQGKE